MPDRRRLDQPRQPRRVELPRFDPEAFGKWSEAIARFMGTARFLVYMTVVICAWVGWNTLAPARWRFDPYTFTFLTLVLSLQASYAAPLILLAQNRQADRDRLAMEEDRRRAAMQKADTEYLSREIAALRHALGEIATRDYLRSELSRLVEEIDESAQRRAKHHRKELRRLTRRQGLEEPAEPRALLPDGPVTGHAQSAIHGSGTDPVLGDALGRTLDEALGDTLAEPLEEPLGALDEPLDPGPNGPVDSGGAPGPT